MPASFTKTLRFRILFSILWFSWAEVHAIVLTHYGYPWKLALTDSGISNLLLAGAGILITTTFQHYIPQKNKYTYIAALVAVLTLMWLFISRAVLLQLLSGQPGYGSFFSQSLIIRGCFGFLINGCMALVSVLWYTIQDQHETEQRKREVEALAKEAELFKLRQQLQPHFLFNSLNSINALIMLQPQKARTMIQQLSDFLRGTLKKEDNQWITIDEELQHLQLYLDIERVRFGHRLTTSIANNTSGKKLQIPAMLLQPVVENAIKFGLYDTTEAITISIETTLHDDTLVIKVRNPYDPETATEGAGTGYGLKAVERRLYLLFGRHNLLLTATGDHTFTTTIKVPQLQ